MINYTYTPENSPKDNAVAEFKKSKYANHPSLNHTVPLNRCVEDLPRTKFRKYGKTNYSYFHCDKNSEHLLIIPNEPIIHIKVSSCGKKAVLEVHGSKINISLTLLKPEHSVYAFKGPITINGNSYNLEDAFTILLKDPDAPRGGNRSITGFDL